MMTITFTRRTVIWLGCGFALAALLVVALITANQDESQSGTSGVQRSSAEQAFLSYVSNSGTPYSGTDQEAINGGYAICFEIMSGTDFYTVSGEFTNISWEESSDIVASAIYNLCPEYSYLVPSY